MGQYNKTVALTWMTTSGLHLVSGSCVPEDLQRVHGLICWDSFNFKFANGATVQYRSVLSMTHVGRIQMIQAQLEVEAHCWVRWGVLDPSLSRIINVEPTTESDQEFFNPSFSQIKSVELTAKSDQECWAHRGVRSRVFNPTQSHIVSIELNAESGSGTLNPPLSQTRIVEPTAESDQECWIPHWVRLGVLNPPLSQIRSVEPTTESDQRCLAVC
jgi:hypothetical protein